MKQNDKARSLQRLVGRRTPYADLVLGVDIFAACIETGVLPSAGSDCHRLMRKLVAESGMAPKRKRSKLQKLANDEAERRAQGGAE